MTDDVRVLRQAKLDRKIERMRARADRLSREAAGKMAAFNHARQDHAWVTQPGYIPGRKRITDRYGKGVELDEEARQLRERADELERRGAVVKGDRERKREALRERLDEVIDVGSIVHDFAFGRGEVLRVNRKTYRVRFFGSGSIYARDKTFVRLVSLDGHTSV